MGVLFCRGGGPRLRMPYVTVGPSQTVVKHPLHANAAAWAVCVCEAAKDTEVHM